MADHHKPSKPSLTEKYLPKDCWKWMSKKTSFGTTIYDCVKSAVENPDSNCGLYAPDPEAYDVFSELFHPVIAEYHKIDVATMKSVHDLGDASKLEDLPQNYQDAIVSTRVRVGRTVKGYPMASKLTKEQRIELENKVRSSLSKLTGDLAGTYKSLTEMTDEERKGLVEEHLLFQDGDDKYLASAGGYHDWPTGRGLFMNHARNFIVWCNEEDHIRIISMQKGASLKQVWGRLVTAIAAMETVMEFVRHDKFGYLTFCPTNIGTGLRASVHVKVPKIAETGKLDEICSSMELQPRGIFGEHTESVGGVYDISNKIRIGRTEWDLINSMWIGIKKLMDQELGGAAAAPAPAAAAPAPAAAPAAAPAPAQ
jgi:arginine kinase